MSYGGMMSDTLGCEMSDVFRALGVMSGSLGFCNGTNCYTPTCPTSHPIAAWFTHGDADTTVPIAGDQNARDHFIKNNGCDTTNTQTVAMSDGGIKPEEVSYINTHGTATDLGDIAETRAIKAVFGEHAYKIPCNSTKSMTGHLLGSAGAAELVAVVKSIETGILHPTINLDDPDPECDLDYVPNVKRAHEVKYALSNSFGFGGHNVTVAVGKLDGNR